MQRHTSNPGARVQPRSTIAAALAGTAVALSIMVFGATGISQSVAQPAAAEIGYVASVSGRVVLLSESAPVLLDPLDVIRDRARIDLGAGSELRMCHYPKQRLLTLKGPLRASISAHGVTADHGKPVDLSATRCSTPRFSKHQGGLVARGIGLTGDR